MSAGFRSIRSNLPRRADFGSEHLCATPTLLRTRGYGETTVCCHALCWQGHRGSCAIRRPLPAICCSEHVVHTSTTSINLVTKDSLVVVVRLLMASIANTPLSVQAIRVLQRT